MFRRSSVGLATFPALLTIVLSAGLTARQQATQPPPAAPPTFRAATQLVQVDVVVKDTQGNFVSDLKKSDFRIYDEGKLQAVDTFALVGAPAGTTMATEQASGAPLEAPNLLPPTRPIFIFVFDSEHLLPGSFRNVQQAAEGFLRRTFNGNALGGVVTDNGMVGNRLMSERADMEKAIKGLKPRDDSRSRRDEQAMIQRGIDSLPAPGRYVDSASNAMALAATTRLLATLRALMVGLEKFEGPKTIVFVSDGFYSDPTSPAWPAEQQVIGLAGRARARIYSIDARGLNYRGDTVHQLQADPTGNQINPTQQVGSTDAQIKHMIANSDPLSDGPNSLAVDTGGYAVRHTNEFGKALDGIAADSQTYYLVGFRPTNTDFNGKLRKLEVKVDRPGVTVRARKGYLAVPPSMR